MLDYHLHLLRHGEDGPYQAEEVRAYARAAAARGVDEICITEHLFRFRVEEDLVGHAHLFGRQPVALHRRGQPYPRFALARVHVPQSLSP